MADYLIKGETLTDIADEVRELSGTNSSMTTSAMITNLGEINDEVVTQENLISNIKSALVGKSTPSTSINLQDKTITENGTYTADSGYDGLGSVVVNVVGSGSTNENFDVIIRNNSSQTLIVNGCNLFLEEDTVVTLSNSTCYLLFMTESAVDYLVYEFVEMIDDYEESFSCGVAMSYSDEYGIYFGIGYEKPSSECIITVTEAN